MHIDGQETFISHLIELRDRLLRASIAWIVLFVCLFPFANDLYTVRDMMMVLSSATTSITATVPLGMGKLSRKP